MPTCSNVFESKGEKKYVSQFEQLAQVMTVGKPLAGYVIVNHM